MSIIQLTSPDTVMPQLTLKCANCQSKGLKKLSLVYLQGTSNRNSFTIGFYRGLKGNIIANTLGTKQSLLAQRAAPPQKKGMALFLIGWFVACLILAVILIIAMINSNFEGPIAGIGFAVGGIAFVGGAVLRGKTVSEYNSRTWSKAYARWERSYLCTQCGRVNII